MVRLQAPARIEFEDRDDSPLSSLSRTLDSLEARLARLPARGRSRRIADPVETAEFEAAIAPKPAALADAVSQIVMRRQMLDAMTERKAGAHRQDTRGGQSRPSDRRENGSLIRRLEHLATEADNLHREDGSYRAISEVASELQRLRDELYSGGRASFEQGFDELRGDFAQLRRMMSEREGAEAISAKLQVVSAALATLTEAGADRSTLNSLRSELEEIRHVFRRMGDEGETTAAEPWRAMEHRYAAHMKENTAAKTELKGELERLRESLRSLAREDQVQAVEARWDALEKRLGHERVEESIELLSERMAKIEAKLDELPGSLDRTALEEQVRALAENVETLSQRGSVDPQQFHSLEERLDEIAGAIVAIHDAAPAVDAGTIERIETRIESLAGRIDEIAGEGNFEILSQRIADLSARVEELASDKTGADLAGRISVLGERFEAVLAEYEPQPVDLSAIEARIGALAERFETAIAEIETPSVDTSAIEERLSALTARLEESAAEPRVDERVVRSLEGQIERLAESLTRVGSMQEDFEADFEQRLQVMEQRLEEHREMLVDAAREIADETARRMQSFGEEKQAEHVLQLSESLRSLETLSRESDGRSTQVFDAVHKTLLKIVDRLELIEADLSDGRSETETAAAPEAQAAPSVGSAEEKLVPQLRQKADDADLAAPPISLAERARDALAAVRPAQEAVAAAPAEAASEEIDREEMNRPLEPGSGTPDIGTLLERVRAAQRSRAQGIVPAPVEAAETRAAARDAAKAASEEMEKLRASSETQAETRGGLRSLIAGRRKAIITGVVAVIAALSALPVGKIVNGEGGQTPVAAIEEPAVPSRMVDDSAVVSSSASSAAVTAAPQSEVEPSSTASANDPSAETPATASTAEIPQSATPSASEPMADAVKAEPTAIDPQQTNSAPVEAAAGTADAVKADGPASSPAAAAMNLSHAGAQTMARGDNAAPTADAASAPVADAAQAVSPAPVEAASAEPAISAAGLLDAVRSKLPVSARAVPTAPEGIGPAVLIEAARSGDPKATFEIGLRLMEGRDGKPDPQAALDWFAQSALKGFAPAQYSIGTLYEKGNGIARDTEAARDWYTLAADGGNVRAMHNLAVLYATGIDGRSQPEVAGRWFQQAAEHGMRDSQYNLGILYARGSGVPRDLVQSYKWFGIVADSGDTDAAAKRDEVGRNLTQDQLRRGQEAVRSFSPAARTESANTVDTPREWQDRPEQTSSIDMTKAIRNIQAILVKLGYDAGTPDGKIGEKTRTAIASFQKDNGMATTGEIDGPLIRALLQRKNS